MHEHVADAARCPQPALLFHHLREQFVRVDVALHHGADFLRVDHGDGSRRGLRMILDIDDGDVGDVHAGRVGRLRILLREPMKQGAIRPSRCESSAPPSEFSSSGETTAVGIGGRRRQRSTSAPKWSCSSTQQHRQLLVLQDDRGRRAPRSRRRLRAAAYRRSSRPWSRTGATGFSRFSMQRTETTSLSPR